MLNESTIEITIEEKEENSIINISEDIDIQYVREYEPKSYRVWLNRILNGKFYLGSKVDEEEGLKYQTTSISPVDSKILINRNGQIMNEDDIILNGYMGWERIAHLIPSDYSIQE